MNNMPLKLREELAKDPYYQVCARSNAECEGRITWEHALMYAGKQIQAKFAVIPECEFHTSVNRFQDGGGMHKKTNEWIAVGRATKEDKKKYPNFPWSKYK